MHQLPIHVTSLLAAREFHELPLLNQVLGILLVLVLFAVGIVGPIALIVWMSRDPRPPKRTPDKTNSRQKKRRSAAFEVTVGIGGESDDDDDDEEESPKKKRQRKVPQPQPQTASSPETVTRHCCSQCNVRMKAKIDEKLASDSYNLVKVYKPVGGWWRCTGCSHLYCDNCVGRSDFTNDDGERDARYSCPNPTCRHGKVEPVFVV